MKRQRADKARQRPLQQAEEKPKGVGQEAELSPGGAPTILGILAKSGFIQGHYMRLSWADYT
ncbi:MAG: hypothetical protein ACHQ7M_17985, partial [Chloroflexota bacterium]